MNKIYAIAGITGLVLLLSTMGVYAYMYNGNGIMEYRNNMMNSYYPSQNQPNQNMMQVYSYEEMDKLHNSIAASIHDPMLRSQMNKMHESCIGNRDSYSKQL